MSTHTAILLEVPEQAKPLRTAAGRWARHDGTWLVKVKKSMHTPGRAARVRGRDRDTVVELGEVVSEDGEYVLSEFIDSSPKPPRDIAGRATEAQIELLRKLWESHSNGGNYASTENHILSEPSWNTLLKSEAAWYITTLKEKGK